VRGGWRLTSPVASSLRISACLESRLARSGQRRCPAGRSLSNSRGSRGKPKASHSSALVRRRGFLRGVENAGVVNIQAECAGFQLGPFWQIADLQGRPSRRSTGQERGSVAGSTGCAWAMRRSGRCEVVAGEFVVGVEMSRLQGAGAPQSRGMAFRSDFESKAGKILCTEEEAAPCGAIR